MLFSLLSLDLILYRVRDELLEVDNILVVGKTVEEVQNELQRVPLNKKETIKIVATAPPKDVTTL